MTVLLDDSACGLVAHPVRWWEVLASHARSRSLYTALAAGHEPEEGAALAVRAAWLTTARVRRGVASCLEQILGRFVATVRGTTASSGPTRSPSPPGRTTSNG